MKLKRRLAWGLGYDLININKASSAEALARQLRNASRPDILFDVGANKGQYATSVLADGFRKPLVSFEPLSVPRQIMLAEKAKYPNWIIADQAAIGEEAGEVEINISARDTCSSILPMSDNQLRISHGTEYVATETVPVRRLDDIGPEYMGDAERIYLKMDVQGFEPHVLNGATGILDKVVAIQTEMSFLPLYDGEMLAFDLIAKITGLGFAFFGLSHALREPDSRRLVQADGFFIRP